MSCPTSRPLFEHGGYRRAYFDDGTPPGSADNSECRIDSISQSWAVFSGAGDAERARMAMGAVNARLVRRDHAIIRLLDPLFDQSDLDPGYIKGYVPGVRENNGQYAHGAIWAAMAFAALGDSQRAWEPTTINPASHAKSQEAIATYKVEPYVMTADVYAVAPHSGRAGWTWYTGSAGWMYRLIAESLLGLRLEVDRLHVAPCLPAHWDGLKIHYRFRETVYHIAVSQIPAGEGGKSGVMSVMVDGVEHDGQAIALVDDQREPTVEVFVPAELGGSPTARVAEIKALYGRRPKSFDSSTDQLMALLRRLMPIWFTGYLLNASMSHILWSLLGKIAFRTRHTVWDLRQLDSPLWFIPTPCLLGVKSGCDLDLAARLVQGVPSADPKYGCLTFEGDYFPKWVL